MTSEFCVLIAIYKNDDPLFLDEALKSIYSQTRAPEEVVLVCDGEITVQLELIVSKYSKLFIKKGIIFFNPRLENNSGLGKALNYGVSFCTKPYIVRMDSDDISTSNRLEILEDFIIDHPDIDVVGTYIEEFSKDIGDLGRFRKVKLDNDEIVLWSKKRNPMNHVTVCMKRKTLISVGNYEDILWHEDYYLWMKMIEKGCILKNLPVVSVHVRVSDFAARRLGLKYVRSELIFLERCKKLGVINSTDKILYMLPRICFRVLPPAIVEHLYKILRRVA
jgi:glycosyltransferase involved in cell wall biosynthesis